MARSFHRYAVLGGDGVFGMHMVKYLLEHVAAERVISIGRNQRKPPVYSLDVGQNDSRFAYYQCHTVHEHDILMRILDAERPSCIINFAALAYATSWTDSYRYYDTNVVSLARMTEDIRDREYFEHWMQIGSSEVYGPALDGPCSESAHPMPTSPYAVSKLAGDLHLQSYSSMRPTSQGPSTSLSAMASLVRCTTPAPIQLFQSDTWWNSSRMLPACRSRISLRSFPADRRRIVATGSTAPGLRRNLAGAPASR